MVTPIFSSFSFTLFFKITKKAIFYSPPPPPLRVRRSTARGRGVLVLVQNFAARGLSLA